VVIVEIVVVSLIAVVTAVEVTTLTHGVIFVCCKFQYCSLISVEKKKLLLFHYKEDHDCPFKQPV